MKKKQNGYIIRDEEMLEDDKTQGLNQIVAEGTRVSKGESVFRYYIDDENEILSQIEELNKQIDEALSQDGSLKHSPDIMNIEVAIKNELDNMFEEDCIQNIKEYQKRINNYILKKGEIAGNLSSEDSEVRRLVNERKVLTDKLIRRF